MLDVSFIFQSYYIFACLDVKFPCVFIYVLGVESSSSDSELIERSDGSDTSEDSEDACLSSEDSSSQDSQKAIYGYNQKTPLEKRQRPVLEHVVGKC